MIGALTEIHNPLSFLYGMVLEREGYQMPSFVLNDVRLQTLSIHHGKKEMSWHQVLCSILQSLSILVKDDATNAEKKKQEAWAGQGIPYCTAQTFA